MCTLIIKNAGHYPLVVAAVGFLIFSSAFSLSAADVPSQWEVKFDAIPIYKIQKAGDHQEVLFMACMDKNSDPDKQVAVMVDLLKRTKGAEKVTTEQIKWKAFNGYLVTLKRSELVDTYIYVSDGTRFWQGQYTGKETDLPEVLNILKTVDLK